MKDKKGGFVKIDKNKSLYKNPNSLSTNYSLFSEISTPISKGSTASQSTSHYFVKEVSQS